jgi:hypothetical protein
MSGKVTVLRPNDCVRLDAGPVAAIHRDMGSAAAEQLVVRAMAEVALIMAGLVEQVQSHDLAGVPRQLRRLQRMAEHLGMVSLALVAAELRQCHDRGDATAFAAVWARLVRVAERSLTADQDLLGRGH